jgi:AcrR family transcriptional regulator
VSPKEELEQERRQQILDAAETVFSEQGFNDARMDDIVAESGLSKGALYWYYKSKDAIIMALLDRVFLAQMNTVENLVKADGTAEEKLRTFTRAAVADIRHFERFMNLGYEFVALATRRKEVREKIRGYYRTYTQILAGIIEQGISTDEFATVDPHKTALAIIGLYEGITLMWFIDPENIDWDELTEAPLDMLLDGIRKKES